MTLPELEAEALRQIWRSISQVEIQRCINMCERLRKVIENMGGNTHY